MTCGINVIVALLACATAASAMSAPFPHENTTVYQYRTVVTTTNRRDGGLYSSQFVLQGTLDVTHDTSNPELVNAYNVVLSDVATDMHNGITVDYDSKPVPRSVDNAASVIEQPFLIIYSTNGTFHGIKMADNEPEWSKNIKMAMATMLQLDLPNINVKNLTNVPDSFITKEKTIHGDCSVTYNVYPRNRASSNISEVFSVNKTFSPMDCFAVHDFSNVDNEHSKGKGDDRMLTESTRNFEIDKLGEEIFIKKLVAYGVVGIFSSTRSSYAQYVITNTTFEFLRFKDKSENDRSSGNLIDSPIIRDVTYRKPRTSYVPNAAIDVTQGRHVVDLTSLPSRLEKLLIEAANYIDENHFDPSDMDWNRTQTVNKILRTMSYMDADALRVTFDNLKKVVLPRAAQMKNIFLGVVSQVGTPASCHFARNIILNNEISDLRAIDMLVKLPLSVRVPTPELLTDMEGLAKLNNSASGQVRKTGILSFASLIYRTFKHLSHPEDSVILNKYLRDFLDHVKNEPTNEMKVVYLMAIRNIQIGKIYDLLRPIIDGSLAISEDPERIRLLAIWSIDKAVQNNYNVALDHLWPVMANKSLPIKLRIAAYEILMNQAPDENFAINVHRYVITEGNEHFCNYHYTTLDSIAKSPDRSKNNIRTIARTILEATEIPKVSDRINTRYRLSGVFSVSVFADTFNHAENINIGTVVNELTGFPEVVKFEMVVVDKDGSVSETAMQVHIEGHETIMDMFAEPRRYGGLTLAKLRVLLEKAAESLPSPKKLIVDIIMMRNGRVFIANHYSFQSAKQMYNSGLEYCFKNFNLTTGGIFVDHQNVIFHRVHEKQMTSDIGVPVIVETRVPVVYSLYVNFTMADYLPLPSNVEFAMKLWKHGDHSMSVYNPIKDVWHAVRSVTVTEVSLPFRTIITTERFLSDLQFNFPARPAAFRPVAGFFIRGKHLVTVDDEGNGALMESCRTCRHQEEVRQDTQREDSIEYEIRTFESKATGLKFSRFYYDCEYGSTSEMDFGPVTDWDRSSTSYVQNTWGNIPLIVFVHGRQMLTSVALNAQKKNCRVIFMVEPSTNNSISRIDVNLLAYHEDLDKNERTRQMLHAEQYRFGATFDVIPSLTNQTVRFWAFDVNVNMNRGHLTNQASLRVTRKTPGEKDLKICFDAKNIYPAAPADDLKVDGTNEEIESELTYSAGYTNEEECVRNEALVSITLKAQMSDEQKNYLQHDMKNSACSEDKNNPLLANPKSLVPRTVSCLQEAIRYTTPRSYTFDVTYKKISQNILSFVDPTIIFYPESHQSGNFKVQANFSLETNSIDFQLTTNASDSRNYNVSVKDIVPGLVMKPLWDFPLDNSRFSFKHLYDYTYNKIRLCSVHPEIILTDDGVQTPFVMPSDTWTLVTGDNLFKTFAVFAKQSRPNYLSFLVFVKDHFVHFFNRKSDNVFSAMTDDMVETVEDFTVPLQSNWYWSLKVTRNNDHFVVRTKQLSITLLVGSNYISVGFPREMQGRVSGLCGYLNGTFIGGKPEIHSTNDMYGY